jgi:hypothetical protein
MAWGSALWFLLQAVWVVDDGGGPGVNFTDIQPAIAAAADGDVVLVREGTYSPFTLSGKGLRILGEGPGTTVVSSGTTFFGNVITAVTDIPASSRVWIEGLQFTAPFSLGLLHHRVVVSGATTRATLSQVVVAPASLAANTDPNPVQPALTVDGSEVHLYSSDVTGYVGKGCFCVLSPPLVPGGAGLGLKNGARVHVASSQIQGGAGGSGSSLGGSFFPSPGGPGITVESGAGGLSFLWVANSLVRGGNAGVNTFSGANPTFGGAGLKADSSVVRVSGDASTLLQGGNGSGMVGPGGTGIATSGSAAVDIHSVSVLGGSGVPPGPATSGPGIASNLPPLPIFELSGSLHLNGSVSLALSNGPPGAAFVLVLSSSAAYFGIPGPFLGEFLTALPLGLFLVGTLSPAGDFNLTLPLALPPAFAYANFHLQGAALDGAGTWRLSNAVGTVLRP